MADDMRISSNDIKIQMQNALPAENLQVTAKKPEQRLLDKDESEVLTRNSDDAGFSVEEVPVSAPEKKTEAASDKQEEKSQIERLNQEEKAGKSKETSIEAAERKKQAAKSARVSKSLKAARNAMNAAKAVKSAGKGRAKINIKIIKNNNGEYDVKIEKTAEYEAHDKYMENVKTEYFKKTPEPQFSETGSKSGSETAEHAKWRAKYEKYMQKQEQSYQQENEDYAAQFAAVNRAKLQAKMQNQSLKADN